MLDRIAAASPPPMMWWLATDLPGRLGITPRPRGAGWLPDDVHEWRAAGIDVVVSLLEREEAAELALTDEESVCGRCGITFISVPTADRGVPTMTENTLLSLLADLSRELRRGASIAVHCRQGIGRSAVLSALLLVALHVHDDAEAALAHIAQARGRDVPDTPEQRAWAIRLAGRARSALLQL